MFDHVRRAYLRPEKNYEPNGEYGLEPRANRRVAASRDRQAMTGEQATAFAVLGVTLALFVWGRWRYDLIAIVALLAVVLLGLVPPAQAFAGFMRRRFGRCRLVVENSLEIGRLEVAKAPATEQTAVVERSLAALAAPI